MDMLRPHMPPPDDPKSALGYRRTGGGLQCGVGNLNKRQRGRVVGCSMGGWAAWVGVAGSAWAGRGGREGGTGATVAVTKQPLWWKLPPSGGWVGLWGPQIH